MRSIRFKCWDKQHKIMTPSFPIQKCTGDTTGRYVFLQSTNTKDKNGIEIYESNIISFPSKLNDFYGIMQKDYDQIIYSDVIAVVIFKEGALTFDYQSGYEGVEVSWDDVEIIGNIYEHSGLLKEK